MPVERQRTLTEGYRLIEVALRCQRRAEVAQRVRVGRPERNGSAKTGDRRVHAAGSHEQTTEVVVDLGHVPVELKGFAIAGDSLVGLSLLPERIAKVVECCQVARIEIECPAIAGDCLIQAPLGFQSVAEVAVCVGEPRQEPDSPAIGRYCIVQTANFLERVTEIGVIGSIPGIDGDRLADQLNGQVPTSCLVSDHAQEMKRIGVSGIGSQDLPVELLGAVQHAGPVVAHRLSIQQQRCGGCLPQRLSVLVIFLSRLFVAHRFSTVPTPFCAQDICWARSTGRCCATGQNRFIVAMRGNLC